MWFRHESCIRRDIRHEPLLLGCRSHPETCVPVRRVSRLAEPGRTCSGRVDLDGSRRWRLVGLPLAQHPIAGLGEMPGNGNDGAAMSLARRESMVEQSDMALAIGLEPDRAGGGFDEAPFQIVVDVAAGPSMPDAPSAGDDARHQACIAGEVLGPRKTFDLADLQPDERRENLADAWHSAEQPDLGRRLERGGDAVLDSFDLGFELIERGELHLNHGRRIAGQSIECGVDVDAALDAEEIADAGGLKSVAVDRCVDAMLERRAQIA